MTPDEAHARQTRRSEARLEDDLRPPVPDGPGYWLRRATASEKLRTELLRELAEKERSLNDAIRREQILTAGVEDALAYLNDDDPGMARESLQCALGVRP